jgi:hypothetical protein
MSWYTLYNTATGKREGHSELKADPVPDGMTQIETADRKDQGGFVWSTANKQWEVAPPVREIPIPEILQRLTLEERMAYYVKLGALEPNCRTVKEAMTVAHLHLNHKADLDDPATAQIVGLLAKGGVIAQERISEILA